MPRLRRQRGRLFYFLSDIFVRPEISQCALSSIWGTPFVAGYRLNLPRCAEMFPPASCQPSSTTLPMMCSTLAQPSLRRSLMCPSTLPPASRSLAATLTPKVGLTRAPCRCDKELQSTISSSSSILCSRPLRNRSGLRSTCSSHHTMFSLTGTTCTMASFNCAMPTTGGLPVLDPAC